MYLIDGGVTMRIDASKTFLETMPKDEAVRQTAINSKGETVYYAGRSVLNNSLIDDRREFGRNQAMQVLKGVFETDKKVDQQLRAFRENIKQSSDQIASLNKEIDEVDLRQKELMEMFDVKPGDQEFEDLMLLNKERIYKKYGYNDEEMQEFFSEDEIERLKQLNEKGLSEFQKAAIDNQEARELYKKQKMEHQEIIKTSTHAIDSILRQKLKSHPMVDAQEAAEDIVELTDKSIMSMLINEGVEKIEKEAKENQEKVEKAQEEKQEEEEKEETDLEIINDNSKTKIRNNKNEVVNNMLDVTQAQIEISKIIDDMQLMKEDLKGLVLDKTL